MNKITLLVISFLIGNLTCYISLQYRLLKIDTEINVPNFILSIITLILGYYIATSIQRRTNKRVQVDSYLIGEILATWKNFQQKYCDKFSTESIIEPELIRGYITEILNRFDDLKNTCSILNINIKEFSLFCEEMENLEEMLSGLDKEDNKTHIPENAKTRIKSKISTIKSSFDRFISKL